MNSSSSSSSSTIQINSYFNSNDLRRFDLELLPIGAYQRLVERLLAVYTDLTTASQFHLYWLDDEKELIGFSNDAELEYAIKYQIKFHGQKRNMCFSKNKNAEPLLKVYVNTEKESVKEMNEKKGSKISQKLSGLIKKVGSEEIAVQARKSISRDFRHIRDQNVNLLRPKAKTRQADVSVRVEAEGKGEDEGEVPELEKSPVVLSGEEQLREEIRAVQESSVWDERTKEDKILRLNVKFYISNLLDNICRDERGLDLSK